MQGRFQTYVQRLNKTPGYFLEKLLGFCLGAAAFYYSYKYYASIKLDDRLFGEKLLDASIALFGFLLVILTLIVQSTSEVVAAMKKSKFYKSLIAYNKKVILLTALVSLISLLILFLKELFSKIHPTILPVIECINLGMFVWAIVDTFLYIRVFYKIIAVS